MLIIICSLYFSRWFIKLLPYFPTVSLWIHVCELTVPSTSVSVGMVTLSSVMEWLREMAFPPSSTSADGSAKAEKRGQASQALKHDILVAVLPCSLFPFHILQARRPCQIVIMLMKTAARPKTMLVMISGDNEVDEKREAAVGAELGDMDMMQEE